MRQLTFQGVCPDVPHSAEPSLGRVAGKCQRWRDGGMSPDDPPRPGFATSRPSLTGTVKTGTTKLSCTIASYPECREIHVEKATPGTAPLFLRRL